MIESFDDGISRLMCLLTASSLPSWMDEFGVTQSVTDPVLWTQHHKDSSTLILLWLNDLLIASTSLHIVDTVKKLFLTASKGKDLNEPGAKYRSSSIVVKDRGRQQLTLSQPQHVQQLRRKLGMLDAAGRPVPLALTWSILC